MSRARKKRDHLVRNGKTDPSASRLSWNGVNPITKKTPTKQTLIDRAERKYNAI